MYQNENIDEVDLDDIKSDKEFIIEYELEQFKQKLNAISPEFKVSGDIYDAKTRAFEKINTYREIFRKSKSQLTPTDAEQLNTIHSDMLQFLKFSPFYNKQIDSSISSMPRKFYPNQSKTGKNILNTLDYIEKTIKKAE